MSALERGRLVIKKIDNLKVGNTSRAIPNKVWELDDLVKFRDALHKELVKGTLYVYDQISGTTSPLEYMAKNDMAKTYFKVDSITVSEGEITLVLYFLGTMELDEDDDWDLHIGFFKDGDIVEYHMPMKLYIASSSPD